jgi:hypothetical protein
MEIQKAQPLVPKAQCLLIEMAIEKIIRHKYQVLIRFQQN